MAAVLTVSLVVCGWQLTSASMMLTLALRFTDVDRQRGSNWTRISDMQWPRACCMRTCAGHPPALQCSPGTGWIERCVWGGPLLPWCEVVGPPVIVG